MKYNIAFPPNYLGEIETFKVKYGDFFEYNLFSIGKESYIVSGIVENSDEGHSSTNKMIHNLQIGRYCSIAEDVHFLIGRGKNYRRISTSNAKILHMAPNTINSYREKGSIIIENDVWIGRKVTIMSGVIIHNGAIIAANSHVVNDVPPYAIVGGNPAKVIGYRFEQDIIDKLQMIQWWYWSDEKIRENAEYFNDDIERFCDKFYLEEKDNFEKEYADYRNLETDKYLMVVDSNDNYSVLETVLDEFIQYFFADEQKELCLFLLENETVNEYIEQLVEIIGSILQEPEMKAKISVEVGCLEAAKKCLASAQHLIINRMPCTVKLMCFAEKFKKKIEIISGVDSKVF